MAGRPSSTQRARRLLALLPYLQQGGSIPLAELARVTGTDEATVAADLTTLSMCSTDPRDPESFVGVMAEDGAAVVFGGTPALDSPVRLTAAETLALLAALEECGAGDDDPLVQRLTVSASQIDDPEEIALSVRAAAAPGGEAHTYAQLVAATAGRRCVRIDYASPDRAATTERVVHPYGLAYWRGHWYLDAYCELAGETRTFRADRITRIEPTGETFEVPDELPARAEPLPELGDLPIAEVRFAADAPDLSEREWPGATFERRDDGSVLARIPYAGTGWISRRVAARLGDAEVLSPAEVREAVADRARRLLKG